VIRVGSARARAVDVAVLGVACVLAALVGAHVRALGFTHVSDDDYARVVIAQLFAHAPALDPSGTSWLPFPFWLNGALMVLFGRSIATARTAAFALGLVSVAPPYLAARAIGVARPYALVAVVLGLATPWTAWLAVATVPEALTGSLVAAGAMMAAAPRGRAWGGLALLVASLSRYEAWPVAAGFAIACAYDALRAPPRASGPGAEDARGARIVAASLAAIGPLAWMAWNAHAHGSALHFFARVATFRRESGGAAVPLATKLTTYPQALLDAAPWIVSLAAIGALGMIDRGTRARWTRPLVLGLLLLAFLVAGDVEDGAPTHHPERALVALFWLLAAFGVDGARALSGRIAWARPRREMWVVATVTAAAIAWLIALPAALRAYPAQTDAEARGAQIERGEALRRDCAYEHFALLAGFGAPERADVGAPTHAPVTAACPSVAVHR
jgi:hypothetical protein